MSFSRILTHDFQDTFCFFSDVEHSSIVLLSRNFREAQFRLGVIIEKN